MARARPVRAVALKLILRSPPSSREEFIVYRGSIHKTGARGELLLRSHLSLIREWAVFRTSDLVGHPIPVPAAQRTTRERSHDIFEISIRKGARARHVQEWLYPVGKYAAPRGIEDHATVASVEEREATRMKVTKLLAASGRGSSYGALFHGLVLPGLSPTEFALQPNPGDRREWCAIRIEDVVHPDGLVRIPSELLPARLHRFTLYFVPLRAGAIVRAMWDKERIVSVPPEYEPPEAGLDRRGGSTTVAGQGTCSESPGACPPGIGGTGYPCGSAGSFCRAFGIAPCSGTCKTVSSWVWTCRCDCC
jgi:hypothetical protein